MLVSDSRKKWMLLILASLFLIGLSLVDYWKEPAIVFSFFYAIPIALVTWVFGFWPGVGSVLFCAMVATGTDIHFDFPRIYEKVIFWNAAIRTVFYFMFSLMVVYVRGELMNEYTNARRDVLTGVYNSRAFFEMFDRRNFQYGYQCPITIAYLDLDNFKKINDQYGHQAGDSLLALVTRSMKKCVKDSGVIARLGGDEFVITFPSTDSSSAQLMIQKLRRHLLELKHRKNYSITFSLGMVTYLDPPVSMGEAVHVADQLMYEAKKSGKDSYKAAVFSRSHGIFDERRKRTFKPLK